MAVDGWVLDFSVFRDIIGDNKQYKYRLRVNCAQSKLRFGNYHYRDTVIFIRVT